MKTTIAPTSVLRADVTEAGAPTRVWLSTQLDEPADDGKREISGLFTLYDVEVSRRNWMLGTTKFKIAAGALTMREDAKAFYGHDWQTNGMPIGRVTNSEDVPEGVRGTITLSKTTKADEVYALCLDGTLDKFSIGFDVLEYAVEGADTDEATLVITSGEIFENSVVPFPQFTGAAVDEVLSIRTLERNTMDPEDTTEAFSAADGATLTLAVDQLTAQLATLGNTPGTPDNPAEMFANYGEYVKAMVDVKHELHADAQKLATTLAYEGGKVADTTYGAASWVGDITRIIERSRKVWNLFDSAPLPDEGMKLEYGKVVSNTIDVAQQLLEGDKLVMGKISVGSDFADVFTFGGGAEMSFQQVKRSSINVVDFAWGALARAYGKTTEQFARVTLAAVDATEVGTLASLTDAEGWLGWFVDVALHFDEKGMAPEYLRITPDVFKDLALLRLGTDGPFLLNQETGTINIKALTGDVLGVPIVLTPGANVVEVGNSFALKTFESSGAPARLGPQEDILHLTEAIGVYGFDAIAVQDEDAIVRPATV